MMPGMGFDKKKSTKKETPSEDEGADKKKKTDWKDMNEEQKATRWETMTDE